MGAARYRSPGRHRSEPGKGMSMVGPTAAYNPSPSCADTDAYVGCLMGTAVGDALGLPYEGLSPRRGARMFPDLDRYHLLPGYGMVSDDTEHACFAGCCRRTETTTRLSYSKLSSVRIGR